MRYPENDPDGDGLDLIAGKSTKQYGYVKQVHMDVSPSSLSALIGSGSTGGDLTSFTLMVPRRNTPGIYQDLTTSRTYDRAGEKGPGVDSLMAYSNGLVLTHLNDARTASANQPGMPAGQLRGYDRLKKTTDAVGGTVERVYDPANNVIRVEQRGTIGGASPTDRTGSANQLLTRTFEYFDELSRQYETQRDVFLPTGATLGERNGVRESAGINRHGVAD